MRAGVGIGWDELVHRDMYRRMVMRMDWGCMMQEEEMALGIDRGS